MSALRLFAAGPAARIGAERRAPVTYEAAEGIEYSGDML